jgi:hypothetical protein
MICHHLRSSPYWLRKALSTEAMSSAQVPAHAGAPDNKHKATIKRERRMALFQERVDLVQFSFAKTSTSCMQAQLVHQGLCA